MPKADMEILVGCEEEYAHVVATDSLPLCEEWSGHFEVRDIMQNVRDDQRVHPAPRNQYFLADYQDSTTQAPPHQPTVPKFKLNEST